MTTRTAVRTLALMLSIAGAALSAECVPVKDERIRGRDLHQAMRALAGVPADTVLGYTPLPGIERVFSVAQLRQIAAAHHLSAEITDRACFVRETAPPAKGDVIAAMRRAISDSSAEIELIEFSHQELPQGELVFQLSGLPAVRPAAGDAAMVWRGSLKYGGNRSLAVWARVRVRATARRLVATRDLAAGEPIRAEDVAIKELHVMPGKRDSTTALDDAVGAVPRRPIRAGDEVLRSNLRVPNEVEPGDTVRVRVISGAARLDFEAEAVSAGRNGEMVVVRNPSNGEPFKGRVAGRGAVVVEAADTLEKN